MTCDTFNDSGDSRAIWRLSTGVRVGRHRWQKVAAIGGLAELLVDAPPCTLEAARLESKSMANPEHIEIVKQGAEAIRQWREKNPDAPLDLIRAELREVNLSEADLDGANLSEAELYGAHLEWCEIKPFLGKYRVGKLILGKTPLCSKLWFIGSSQITTR